MPRRAVKLARGEWYHLYNRGHNRGLIFFERENYLFFLRQLKHYVLPALDVAAFCLMPTHYHLLGRVTQAGLSHSMQLFSISYTKAMNERYDRAGGLFQGAFQGKHVGRDNYLTHLSRYIHLNPVRAGLVARPTEWEFSSYREYVGARNGELPRPELVLSLFRSISDYQDFVESYAADQDGLIAGLLFEEAD